MEWPTGQERRAWRDRKAQAALDAIQYYLGPGVNVGGLATIADALNPVADIQRAGTAARGAVQPGLTASERAGYVGSALTDMASVLAPVAGAAYADDAARGLTEGLANWSMPADDAVLRFAGDEAGAVPLYGGGMSDPTQTGWTFRDMASPNRDLTAADNQRIARYIGVREETLPIRSMYATQPTVNPDFATTSSSAGELPFVIRKNGKLYVQDGHHRIVRAGEEGAQNARVRFLDLDSAETDTPLLDWTPEKGGYSSADDELLSQLLGPNLSPAEAQAQKVLDLLTSGRASEVTDEMLAAADPQYLYRNYDLPMDEASRMARAREMGFDTDTPLAHGTRRVFDAFDERAPAASDQGWYGRGVYTGSPELASEYAEGRTGSPNVIPLMTRGRQFEWPSGSPAFMSVEDAEAGTRDIARLGYDGVDVRVPNEEWAGSEAGQLHERLVFDPANIRSRFARFDPRLAHLRNLSAGLGGLAALPILEQEMRAYLDSLPES